MNLKKLGAALLAVTALAAIAANSATAAGNWEEPGSAWYTGASPGTKLTGTKAVTSKALTTLSLRSVISGKALKLNATGLSCVSCLIENSGTNAIEKGELELTGVSLIEPDPAVCSSTANIRTKPLKVTVGMKSGTTTITTLKYEPQAGATSTFATVTITGTSCAVSGTYKVTGAVVGEAAPTGTFETEPGIAFDESLQNDALTATSLKFGLNGAYLVGLIGNSIGGTPWAVKAK